MCTERQSIRHALRLFAVALLSLACVWGSQSTYASSNKPSAGFPNTGGFQAKLIKSSNGVAVMELIGNYDRDLPGGAFNIEPRTVVAKEFYKGYADRYDFLLVFSAFEYESGDATAFYHGVRNDVSGIGQRLFDNTAYYGSRGKLQGFIDMAAMSRYNLESTSPQFESVLSITAHEFLHRWAAFVKFKRPDGSISNELLGKDAAHWSFLLETGGSVEYGHRWRDNGDGSFTSISAGQIFSPLDLYLMGMLKKQEVPPFFLINSQDVDPARLSKVGVTVRGSKMPISVDDIIAAEGERQPSAEQAQKEFEFGVVLLTRPGQDVTDEQIQAVNRVRQAFQTRLGVMTGGHLIARASLQPNGLVPVPATEVLAPGVKAGDANMATALSWLKAHQRSEGYWQDNEGTRLRDTTVALAALARQSGTQVEQTQARSWLSGQALQNTDYLARRSLALDGVGLEKDTQDLLARQNADAGWGVAAGYQSNPIDTAWAILSLTRNNTASGAAARTRALGYLVQNQNSDGGWGSSSGAASRTYATTLALQALSTSAEQSDVLNKAGNFLKTRQNPDGGFGDSPSTVHDTANVISALSLSSKLDSIDFNAATRFLNGTQKSDGSWDGSAYSTALALDILGSPGGGNWVLAELQANPVSPRDGQRVNLSVRVWNKGSKATPASVLRYYDGNPLSGGQSIGSDIVVPAMAPGESLLRETVWDTTNKAGAHSIYAYVDPDAQSLESARNDNLLKADITVSPASEGLDLSVISPSVLSIPASVSRLPSTLSISAQVSNLGKADASSVKVSLVSRDSGITLDQQNVILLGRSTIPVTFSLQMDKAGLGRVKIVVDPDGVLKDIDRSNNSANFDIPINSTTDVQILAADIVVPSTAAASPVLLGSDLSFKIKVSNSGTADTPPFQAVYVLSNGTETREIGRANIQLSAGQSREYSLPWRADLAGDITLSVTLDPQVALSESDRSNNEARSSAFKVSAANGANLAVSYQDFIATPSPALESRPLTLSASIRNTGNQSASNIDISFYEGDPAKGGTLIGTQTLASLEAGATAPVQITTRAMSGVQDRLYFVLIDPASQLSELTRADNQAFIKVEVTAMADLVVSASDILITPAQPKAGDAITFDVGINNSGLQNVGPFIVRLYEGDSAQGKQIGADLQVSGLEAQRSTRVSFSLTLPQGSLAQYTLVVDPLEQVEDKSRTNNTATKTFSLQRGDSYVTERYFSPNGDGVQDSTRFGFKLGNAGPYSVQITNGKNKRVRELSSGLSGVEGQIDWDGKDAFGKVVEDGNYSFELLDKSGVAVMRQGVTLDTNGVSIIKSMGTSREYFRNTSCAVPYDIGDAALYSWYDDQRVADDGDTVYDDQRGRFSLSTGVLSAIDMSKNDYSSGDVNVSAGANAYNGGWGGVPTNAAGSFLAARVSGSRSNYSCSSSFEELWLLDSSGKSIRRLLTNQEAANGKKPYEGIYDWKFTSDGQYLIAYVRASETYSNYGGDCFYGQYDATKLLRVSLEDPDDVRTVFVGSDDYLRYGGNTWSPDGRYFSLGLSNSSSISWFDKVVVVDTDSGRIVDVSKLVPTLIGRRSTYLGHWSNDSKYLTVRDEHAELSQVNNVYVINVEAETVSKVDYSWVGSKDYWESWFGPGHKLSFTTQDETGQYVVGVYDADTGLVSVVANGLQGYPAPVGSRTSQSFVFAPWDNLNKNSGQCFKEGGQLFWFDEEGVNKQPLSARFMDYACGYIRGRMRAEIHGFGPKDTFLLFSSDRDTKNGGVCSLSSGDSSKPYTGRNLFSYSTVDNLTVDLRASRSVSGDTFKLQGTAADANFASYKLEYATEDQPTDWHAIGVPVMTERIDAELGQWAPPGLGRYLVRLTARDLAGNSKSAVARVSTYTRPMITDVFKNEDAISPNGDGVQDSLQLHYRVLDPGNLRFEIFNSQNERIKLAERAHTEPGQDSYFVWDGHSDQGLLVPDGRYRIKVLDYEFAFDVDSTPPVLKVELSPRAAQPPARAISLSVVEAALKDVRYETAELGSENWRLVKSQQQSNFELYKAQNKDSKFDFAWGRSKLYVDEYFVRHRIVATDKAGNRVTVEATPGPRELVLNTLSRIRMGATLTCQPAWAIDYPRIEFSPPVPSLPRSKLPELGETLVVLPSIRDAYVPKPKLRDLNKDYQEIEWQPITENDRNSSPRAVDFKAGDLFHKTIVLNFEDLQPPVAKGQRRDVRLEYVERVTEIAPWVKDQLDSLYWQSKPVEEDGALKLATENPTISINFHVSVPSEDTRHYLVRLMTVDADGTIVRSPAYAFFITAPPKDLACSGDFHWTLAPEQSGDCNPTPTGKMNLALDPRPSLDILKPDYLEVERVLSDGRRDVLVKLPYPTQPNNPPDSTQFYSFSTRDWPIGEQNLAVTYYKAGGVQDEVLASNEIKFTVDHGAPTLSLTSPVSGAKLCLQHERVGAQLVNYLPLDGEVQANGGAHWLVEVATEEAGWRVMEPLGKGFTKPSLAKSGAWRALNGLEPDFDDARVCKLFGGVHCRSIAPYQWSSVISDTQTKASPPLMITDVEFPENSGTYGLNVPPGTDLKLRRVVDLATLSGGEGDLHGQIQLRARAFGASGAQTCTAPVSVLIDGRVVGEVVLDKRLFSPNGDGVQDALTLSLNSKETLKLDVLVYPGRLDDKGLPFSPSPVRSLVEAQSVGEGSTDIEWNGLGDGNVLLADGYYSLVVVMTDDCGNEKRRTFEVELDNTAPQINLSAPRTGDLIGTFTAVVGSLADAHSVTYQIAYATEQNAAANRWQALSTGSVSPDEPTKEFLSWHSDQLAEGTYLLRVWAQDSAGNVSEVRIPLVKPTPQDMLAEFEAMPTLFSPNGDGRLETLRMGFGLLQDAKVSLEILSADGSTLLAKLLDKALRKQGLQSFEWNGRNPATGKVLDDADLLARISVESVSGPLQIQSAIARLRLDGSAPVITFVQPATGWATGKEVAQINVQDPVLASSTLSLSVGGVNGPWQLLSENEGAKAGVLSATLANLEEGAYGLKVTARDQAQNVSEQIKAFEIDKTLPKLSLQSPLAGAYISGLRGAIDIQGSVQEAHLARYRLLLGQGAPPAGTELFSANALPTQPSLMAWNAKSVADGRYTLSLLAEDFAGNSAQSSAEITVDNTVPVAAFKDLGQPWYIGRGSLIAGTATDENFLNYKLEIASAAPGAAARWTELMLGTQTVAAGGTLARLDALPADGPASLRLTVTDKAGNTTEAIASVQVDANPPAVPTSLRGQIQNKRDAQLGWDANTEADLAGYAVFRDGVRINTELITQPVYVDASLAEGRYRYTVKAYDKAGNASSESNVLSLAVSLAQPVAAIFSPAQAGYASGILQIKGTANAPNDFKEYRLFIGEGSAPSNWQLLRRSPAPVMVDTLAEWNTLSLPEAAIYTLKLESEDLAGNITTAQVAATIDNRAPAIPQGLAVVKNGAQLTLSWNANSEADLQGYLLTRNERIANATGVLVGSMLPYALPTPGYVDKAVADGKHLYYVQALDKAGNLSDRSGILEVIVDTRAPRVVIAKPLNGMAVEQFVTITGTSEDTDIASVQYQYRPEGNGDWIDMGAALSKSPWSVIWNTQGLALGRYQVRAVATDLAGQTDAAPALITLKLTQLNPNVVTTLSGLASGTSAKLSWSSSDTSNIVGYFVERESTPGVWVRLNSSMLSASSYTDVNSLSDGDYRYRLQTVVDAAGTLGALSNEVLVRVFTPQVEQPYTPTTLPTIDVTGQTMAGMTVEVLRSGTVVATGQSDAEGKFVLAGVPVPIANNWFVVRARDAAGNVSRDARLHLLRSAVMDKPFNLKAVVSQSSVNLSWQHSGSNLWAYLVSADGLYQESAAPFKAATSSSDNASYQSKTQAVDGDVESGWVPTVAKGAWLQVALTQKVLLGSVKVTWASGRIPQAYVLEVYDSTAYDDQPWVPVAKVLDSELEVQTLKLAQPYFTDRYRIRVLNAQEAPRLNEISATRLAWQNGTSASFSSLKDGVHDFTVRAFNSYGVLSEPASISVIVGDVQGPAAAILSAQVTGSDISLNWTHAKPEEVTQTQIWRDGSLLASVSGATYVDALRPNGQYRYQVIGLDQAKNSGAPSNDVVVDVQVSSVGAQLQLQASVPKLGGRVQLAWQLLAGAVPRSYVVQRGTQPGGPYEDIVTAPSALSFEDSLVRNGTDYYYRVVGLDSAGTRIVVSNEVMAHPRDITPPLAPVFMAPTRAGVPLTSSEGPVELRGLSEPGGYVELSQDGVLLRTVAANAQGLVQDVVSLGSAAYDFDVAADERALIAAFTKAFYRYDLASGGVLQLYSPSDVGAIRHAAQGTVAVLSGLESANTRALYRLDSRTGLLAKLSGIKPSRYESYAVSADGRDVFVLGEDASASKALWRYALDGSSIEPLVSNASGQISNVLAPSADGTQLAYVEGTQLKLLTLADKSVREYALGVQPSQMSWSPAGDRLFVAVPYASKSRIGMLNVQDMSWSYLTPEDQDYAEPVASPAGGYYAARKNGSVLVVRSETGSEWVVASAISKSLPIRWSAGGLIHAGDAASASTIRSYQAPGMFVAADVALRVGSNVFGAIGRDEQGNTGPAARPIEVRVLAEPQPELSVRASDIVLVPAAPQIGEASQIAVRVHNAGTQARAVPVLILLLNDAGREVARKEAVFATMEPNETRSEVLAWTPETPGSYRIVAQVNLTRSVSELDYTNNSAQRVVSVAASGSPGLAVHLDAARYASGAQLGGGVVVSNPGPLFDGKLKVQIEDIEGYLVAALPDIAITQLAYAGQINVPVEWAVGSTLAGRYRMLARLYDSSGVFISEARSDFEIGADRTFTLAATTDKAVYLQGEVPRLRGVLTYANGNLPLDSSAVATLSLLDAGGGVLAQRSQSVGGMLAQTTVALDLPFDTSTAVAGYYQLVLAVREGDLSLGESRSAFSIEAAARTAVQGKLSLSADAMGPADHLTVNYQIQNTGSTALASMPVHIRVIDPERLIVQRLSATGSSAGVLASENSVLNLLIGASAGGSALMRSQAGWPLRTLNVVLEVELPDGSMLELDRLQVAVVDRIPPVVLFQTPAEDLQLNTYYDGAIVVQVRDQSSISNVEISLDGTSWTPMSVLDAAQSTYIINAFVPHLEARHTLYVRARDAVGNQSEPVQRQVLVDITPPSIHISGLVQGVTYRSAVQPIFQGVDANLERVTATLDGNSFVSGSMVSAEGLHRLIVVALDAVGNSTTQQIDFEIAPVVLGGTLSLSPQSPASLQTLVLDALVRNDSKGSAISAQVSLLIRKASDNSVVASFADEIRIDAGRNAQMARSWQVEGVAGTRYVAQLVASVEGIERVLATQEFVVGSPVALSISASLQPTTSVLVLASCARAADESTAWCVERNAQNYNPDYDPLCDQARAQFIGNELTLLGFNNRVVNDESSFLKELRSGAYSTYWVDGSATGLDHVTVAELRAALERGDALLLDGLHDAMNRGLASLGGFTYQGRTTAGPGMHTQGALFDVADYALGARAVRLSASAGGIVHAQLTEAAASTGYAAILSNQVGQGRALSIGFDLVAQLQSSADAARLREVLRQSLAYLQRSYLPATQLAGESLVHRLSLNNASGQTADVSVTLPAGSRVLASTSGALVTQGSNGETVNWRLKLTRPQQDLDLFVQVPKNAGKYVLNSTVSTLESDGSLRFVAAEQQVLELISEQSMLDESVQGLQNMVLSDEASEQARLHVLRLLGNARLRIDSKDNAGALHALITAQGYLGGLVHAQRASVAERIARVIAAAGKRM